MQKSVWMSAGQTDIGTARKVNEDDLFEASNAMLWAVADGMGGHEKGDFASRCIIAKLTELVNLQTQLSVEKIKTCIEKANTELYCVAKETDSIIGSTVAALFIHNNKAYSIWAGDSRIYLLRDNMMQRLTRDHSHVEEMLAAGLITQKQAENHPKSNIITRAVGTSAKIDLEIGSIELVDGDAFILCTDGLNKTMSDGEIENTLNQLHTKNIPAHLIDLALARQAKDNVTLVIVSDENRVPTTNSSVESGLEETLL